MSAAQLAVVLLRIYAVTLLVTALDYVASGALNYLWDEPGENGFDVRAHGFAGLAAGLLRTAFAVYLLVRTGAVARFVCRGMPEERSTRPFAANELEILGFGIAGLWLVVDGLHGIAYSYATWRSNLRYDPESRFLLSDWFLAYAVKAVLGLWLFLGARGVVRIARWVRRAGAPETPIPPTPPA